MYNYMNINKTFYYKRNFEKNVEMSRNIKNNFKVGDTLIFHGNLYIDKNHTKEVAKSIIKYKILYISSKGVLIKTSNKYDFHNNGTIIFEGRIFSSNFKIINGVIQSYTTKANNLSLIKGTKKYEYCYGECLYKINNNGLGKVKLFVNIC